jgi:glycosyltransferase involved in cell wall biosynthesis
MKILYGITKSNWGGAQKYVYDTALAARDAGHEVSVLCGGNGLLIEKLEKAGIKTINLPYMGRNIRISSEFRAFVDTLKVLRRERPDVFHINSSKMGGLGALAARVFGVKTIIFTAHGWAFNEARPWYQELIIQELAWITMALSHKTICVSEGIWKQVRHLPFVSHKLVIIKHGVEDFPLASRAEARATLFPGIAEETFLVGTIAELHKVKGLDIALRAFARAFRGKDAAFVIIGGGEEERELKLLATRLGISKQARFAGFVEDGRSLLSGFDAFVLASRSEALGFVLLEAARAELPVIATSVGGIPEIVKNNETGMLVARDSFQELSGAMARLYENTELRKTLARNLREFASKNFSKEKMLEETLKLYA